LTLQRLARNYALEFALVSQINVLVVAPTAAIGTSPIARCIYAKFRSLMYLNNIGAHEFGSHLSYSQCDVFTWQTVPYERRVTERVR